MEENTNKYVDKVIMDDEVFLLKDEKCENEVNELDAKLEATQEGFITNRLRNVFQINNVYVGNSFDSGSLVPSCFYFKFSSTPIDNN